MESWEDKQNQLWIHSSKDRLPLESGQRRQDTMSWLPLEAKRREIKPNRKYLLLLVCWFCGSIGEKGSPASTELLSRRPPGVHWVWLDVTIKKIHELFFWLPYICTKTYRKFYEPLWKPIFGKQIPNFLCHTVQKALFPNSIKSPNWS